MNATFQDWLFEREIKQILKETGINQLGLEDKLLLEVGWLAPMVAGKVLDRAMSSRQNQDLDARIQQAIDQRLGKGGATEPAQKTMWQKFYGAFIKAAKVVGVVGALAAAFYLGMRADALKQLFPSLPNISELLQSILSRGQAFLKTAAEKVIQYVPEFGQILKTVAGFEVARRVVQGTANKLSGKAKEAGEEAVQRGKEAVSDKAKEIVNGPAELPLPSRPRELPSPRRGIDNIAGRDVLRQADDMRKTLTQPIPRIRDKPLPTPTAGDQSWYDYLSGSTRRAAERAGEAIRDRVRKSIPSMPDIVPRPGEWIPRAR